MLAYDILHFIPGFCEATSPPTYIKVNWKDRSNIIVLVFYSQGLSEIDVKDASF